MDISKCFRDAWRLYRADLGPLLVTALAAAIVFVVVSSLLSLIFAGTAGALRWGGTAAGVLGSAAAVVGTLLIFAAGLLIYAWAAATMFRMILRRVRDGRAADYADLRHVDRIGVFAVAFVVLGAIIGAGYALLVVPGLILTTIWIYALPLVADRDCSVSEAMAESRELAAAPGYMNTFAAWLVGALVVGAVAAVVSAIPVIGLVIGLLAAPYFTAYIVSMYFQAIGQGHRIDTALR